MAPWGFITAFVLATVGLFAVFGKGRVGGSLKGALGMIPVGNPTLWGIVLVILGLATGAVAGAGQLWGTVAGSVSTASAVGGVGATTDAGSAQQAQITGCYLSTIGSTTVASGLNSTFRADPNNLAHEYIDNGWNNGAAVYNGTLTCKEGRANIRNGVAAICIVKGDSYRSQTSTTDSNTYFILNTGTSASKIPGMTWAQTAYLNSGSIATTASDQEQTNLVFAQDVVSNTLGYYFQLPGQTAYNYLNNQTAENVNILCGGKQAFQFTVTKTTSN